jgi:hypothetical protein
MTGMTQQTRGCRRSRALVAALDRIARDPAARRELLWLRAKEKDDLETVRSLERADPGLGERLRPFEQKLFGDEGSCSRDRQDAYARLWTERLGCHAPELAAVACDCPSCAGG